MKLPRLRRKIQVALHWTADLFFPHDLTQIITVRGLEKAMRMLDEGNATTLGATRSIATTDVPPFAPVLPALRDSAAPDSDGA
jgi:hypothetical protein